MLTLWLVRHGTTVWNVQKRYQGHSDVPLNPAGVQQAAAVGTRLAAERVHHVVCSDLGRARQTADLIAVHHGLTPAADGRWREASFGAFEGLRYADVMRDHREVAEAWFADPDQPPPDGEGLSEVAGRVAEAVDALVTTYARKRVVLVGHGGALRLALCHLLGMPPAEYWRFNVDPASLSRVNVYPGGAILIRLNDIAHLQGDNPS